MLVKTKNLRQAVDLGEKLLSASLLFRIDEELFESARGSSSSNENFFSFTDCTSTAACRANGVSYIRTFDEDFQEIGDFNVVGQQGTQSNIITVQLQAANAAKSIRA